VSAINDYEDPEWKEDQFENAEPGGQFFMNDFVTYFEGTELISDPQELKDLSLKEGDVAIRAKLSIMDNDVKRLIEPMFLIRDNQVGKVAAIDSDLGIKVEIDNIVPEEGKFVFKYNTYQKDYVVMKASVKPFINVLWLGTIIMLVGFGTAIFRRYDEFTKMRNKGLE
jgi:cytochrome c-type biogenesis protein CcmF